MLRDYFLQNMAVLEQFYPRLAEELRKTDDDLDGDSQGGIRIEAAASGAPTLVYKAVYIHSKRDPEREAERLVESAVGASCDSEVPALVLGFGLGYAACALRAKFPARPIIIVERRIELLKKALELRDLGAFLSGGEPRVADAAPLGSSASTAGVPRSKLAFVLGGSGEGVTEALSLFESSPGVPPLVIQNRALTGIDEDWYAGVEERIKTWNSRTNVNRATQKRFGKRWVRNLSKNLAAVRDLPGISRLEGILRERDIPVFLAAAGPTLDTAGPMLGEIAKRCVTVAVDTSLRFLLGRGIDPDFAVSVDPQYWNFRHLDRSPAPKTWLVAESAVYPPVLRHSFGGIFLCTSFFPLGRFVEDKVDPKGNLGAGGSVATSAWDFIRILGARRVWIAGLDLSFPELRTHFRGALFEEKSHAEAGRFAPAETWIFRALRDGQPFLAKRKGGGTVLTDKRLSLYASWFENRFSRFPHVKNYSLSAEGLAIEGLGSALPDGLLALPERREEIDLLLKELRAAIDADFYSDEKKKIRAENYEIARSTLLGGLEQIKSLAEDAAKSAEKAIRRGRQGRLEREEQDRALKKLDSVNKFITESAVKDISGFLFPETGDWDAEIADGDPLVRYLEFSARFYQTLAEAAGYNLRVLRQAADVEFAFSPKVTSAKADISYKGRKPPQKI